eukprot:1152996-Pleurochrysis_carterae.AAC.1
MRESARRQCQRPHPQHVGEASRFQMRGFSLWLERRKLGLQLKGKALQQRSAGTFAIRRVGIGLEQQHYGVLQ